MDGASCGSPVGQKFEQCGAEGPQLASARMINLASGLRWQCTGVLSLDALIVVAIDHGDGDRNGREVPG
jgi:hypothetical protein